MTVTLFAHDTEEHMALTGCLPTHTRADGAWPIDLGAWVGGHPAVENGGDARSPAPLAAGAYGSGRTGDPQTCHSD
jgi:hypothetical protein